MDCPSPRRNHQHNLNSPNSSTSSSANSNGGLINQHQLLPPPPLTPTSSSVAAQAPTPPPPPPPFFPTRNSFGRSEARNHFPTTFVQADTNTFKHVVQMLTGCNDTARLAASNAIAAANTMAHSSKTHIPPMKTILNKNHPHHQSGFKLYERRSNNLNLNPLLPTLPSNNNVVVAAAGNVGSPRFSSPRNNHLHRHHQEVLSPSILDFPALVLSPVTPLIPDPFGRSSAAGGAGARYNGNRNGNGGAPVLNIEAEERAIKEKGFYFHPSPANTPRDTEPCLLPLFPTISPRAAAAASAAAGSSSSA